MPNPAHALRTAACAGLLWLVASAAWALELTCPPQAVTIVRQTPAGDERLVYLALATPEGGPAAGLTLEVQHPAGIVRRPLLDVPPGGAWDTVWLREPVPESLPAKVVGPDGAVCWEGALAIPQPTDAPVVIPRSDCIRLGQLKPLMLRGTNYYPRRYPWPGIWREMNEALFEAEFTEMAQLNINTIRTFFNLDVEAGLHRPDGTFTPLLLSRINTLLAVAARHRVKTMLCVGAWGDMKDLTLQRRFFRTGVEPFIHDGRILMWDLINEPGGSDGPKAKPELAQWIQTMWQELGSIDRQHIATVGLAWQFDQLWDLGVKPPVGQYHNYSSAVGVQPPGEPPVRNVADDLRKIAAFIDNRPLIIGEFGFTSVEDSERGWKGSEARQLEIVEDVIEGGEAAAASGVQLVGVYNWCAFHFIPDWMGIGEQAFGVIRTDGSLKPAGEALRDTYARWRSHTRAPWED